MFIKNTYISIVNKEAYNTFETQPMPQTQNAQIFNNYECKDTAYISAEAKESFIKMKDMEYLKEKENLTNDEKSLLEYMEKIRKQSMKKSDSSDTLLKCLIIAIRIISGHNVPIKDAKFLAENEPEMYLRAVLLRRENKEPKEYLSILKKECNDSKDIFSESERPLNNNILLNDLNY